MSNATERGRARETLRAYLESNHGGRPKLWFIPIPTTGETRHYRVFILRHAQMLNETERVALVGGYRYNERKQTLVLSGHGYSGPQHIAENIAYDLFEHCTAISYEEA